VPRSETARALVAMPLLWAAALHAELLTGTVVSVADGDTLTVFSQGVAH